MDRRRASRQAPNLIAAVARGSSTADKSRIESRAIDQGVHESDCNLPIIQKVRVREGPGDRGRESDGAVGKDTATVGEIGAIATVYPMIVECQAHSCYCHCNQRDR